MYLINKTDGTQVAQITDGTSDTSTSLTLVGRNYVGYGELLQEDLVKMLENFAYNASPRNPLIGQLWFDTAKNHLSVYTNDQTFNTIACSSTGITAPTDPILGNFWYDTSVNLLRIWNGAAWALIGPKLGSNVVTITDTLTNERDVVIFELNGNVAAIINDGAEFTPASNFYGYSTIKPGLNLTPALTPDTVTLHGISENSALFNGLTLDTFVRNVGDTELAGNLALRSDHGLWLGNDLTIRITNDPDTNTATIKNFGDNGNFVLSGTYLNNPVNLLTANVITGLITVNGPPVDPGDISTKDYVDNNIISNVAAVNNTIGQTVAEINATRTDVVNLTAVKAPIANPNFTGAPRATTPLTTDASTRIATTLFVRNYINSRLANLAGVTLVTTTSNVKSVAGRVGDITLSVEDVAGVAPVANPTFTGNVFAPNVVSTTNSSIVATTAFVQQQKINTALSGAPTAPTQPVGTNNGTLATTAFVTQAVSKVTVTQTGYTKMQVFSSSTSWIVPLGVTKAKVTVVGGGGNGGGASSDIIGDYLQEVAAGGGGGGGTAIKIINGLTPGQTIPVVVGGPGVTSSFGSYCYATGGKSAVSASFNPGPSITFGAEGGVGIGGDINIPGGYGQDPEFAGNYILYRQAGNLGGGTFLAPYYSTGYGAGGAGKIAVSLETFTGGPGQTGVVIVEY